MTKRYLNVLTTGDIKDTVTGELIRGSGIGDLLNELHEEIEYLKPLANENTHYIADMEDDIITFKQISEKLEKENQQLKLELGTYKETNILLKKTIDRLQKENKELKQYKDAVLNCDSSKTIRVNRNTGEVDLIDKEYSNES